jgi:hypothetical protein
MIDFLLRCWQQGEILGSHQTGFFPNDAVPVPSFAQKEESGRQGKRKRTRFRYHRSRSASPKTRAKQNLRLFCFYFNCDVSLGRREGEGSSRGLSRPAGVATRFPDVVSPKAPTLQPQRVNLPATINSTCSFVHRNPIVLICA